MASFGGNLEEQFISVDAWRFLVEFDIEGGSNGASGVGGQSVVSDSPNDHQVSPQCFLCGKKRKPDDMDLNQVASDGVGDEYCTCAETPRVIRQGGSGSGGGQVAVVENNAGNLGGRSRRGRMRQIPRRFEASVGSGSSNGIPTNDEAPITVVSDAIPTFVSSIAATTNGARPFRIRDIVSRQGAMLRSFGSGVEVNHSHPHSTVGGASASALSIWRTSPDGPALIINQFPNLHNMVPNTRRVEYDGSRVHVHIDGQEILLEDPSEGLSDDEEFMNLAAWSALQETNYESLLSLQERIGFMNTGLTELFITKWLRRCNYRAPKNRPPAEAEACCICLVDFVNRDVIGKIDCLHIFHFDCIKEWLMRKNLCPLCKKIAIQPPNRA